MAGASNSRARRRYHFHIPGVVYVGVAVFLAVGALNSQNNLLFAALGLAMGGLLVSGFVSGLSLMGIEVERIQAADTAVGQPMVLLYTIRNTNRFMPAFGLTICESTGGTPAGDWFRVLAVRPRCHVAHIGPGQLLHAESVAYPVARGRATLNAIQVWSTFPFGIAKKSVTFFRPQTVVVRPLTVPLRSGVVDARRRKPDRGASSDRFAGSGDEFFALREYVPGDLPRHIAWRATARTGQLLVTQRAAPTPTRAWVVLRLGGEGSTAPSNERAVSLAASLIKRAADDGTSIGLAIPAAGILRPPDNHRWHVERLLNELAIVDANAPGVPAFPAMAARSGVCLVVWSGVADTGWGPPGARHVTAENSGRLLADPAGAAALASLGFEATARGMGERLWLGLCTWGGSLMRGRGEVGA